MTNKNNLDMRSFRYKKLPEYVKYFNDNVKNIPVCVSLNRYLLPRIDSFVCKKGFNSRSDFITFAVNLAIALVDDINPDEEK